MNSEDKSQQQHSRRNFGKVSVGFGIATLASNAVALSGTESDGQNNNLPEGYEGNIAVATVLTIRKELEKDADEVWDRHKQWLRETHGPWGMVSYSVAKNTEMKNALNPGSTETTGRIIYVIHEIYRHIDGLKKHYSESPNGGYVENFIKLCTAEGSSVVILQGAPVTHSLLPKDCDFPVVIDSNNEGVEMFFTK